MVPKNYAQVELKKTNSTISSHAGLCWIDKALEFAGFWQDINKLLPKTSKSNNAVSVALKIRSEILSRISGATAVEDIEVLRKDDGFSKMTGVKIVSPDTLLNFLSEKKHIKIVKSANDKLVIKALVASNLSEFTYDNDATYFENQKNSARYSYRGTKDFSGLLGFIPELNICATMDFRPGNISPREGIVHQIRYAVSLCKKAKKKIKRIRLDSAGHNNTIFKLCDKNGIDFYITLAKNTAIKEIIHQISKTCWKRYKDTDREYAECVYATNDESCKSIRAIVLRWKQKEQLELFEDHYCYHVIGTNNIQQSAKEVIQIHSNRMASENYNKELKEGYNLEWMPSNDFIKNTNYFYLGIIAYNSVEFVKQFFIEGEVTRYRIKRFRHWFVKTCGKLIKTGRCFIFRIINSTDRTFAMFEKIRHRMQYAW